MLRHSLQGPVRAQRLFQPGEAELFERRRLLARLTDRPALIDIDGEHMIADQPAQFPEIAAVALGAETDLQFEGAMAAANRRLRSRHTAVRIDAARIDAHAPRAAEHPPQRRLRAAGEQVPQGDIDARDGLRERALLPTAAPAPTSQR
jgi:hypothetical protein